MKHKIIGLLFISIDDNDIINPLKNTCEVKGLLFKSIIFVFDFKRKTECF